ncbi:MAG: hypothetical protein BWY63_02085 [Chloroflexi bacterium ADurb.Bin360]|nr:MAG: hypothetical protein BWY63_02085 [Chloroflexi bacterium ADurb.Bin360]
MPLVDGFGEADFRLTPADPVGRVPRNRRLIVALVRVPGPPSHRIVDFPAFNGVVFGDWTACTVHLVDVGGMVRFGLGAFIPKRAIPALKTTID